MFIYKKKNQTGKSYYYLGENKSIKGVTVRAKEIYLGTADNILQRINSKLYLEKINTYEYGLTVSLLQQIRESGLYQTLNDILPFNVRGVPASIAVIIIVIKSSNHNKLKYNRRCINIYRL